VPTLMSQTVFSKLIEVSRDLHRITWTEPGHPTYVFVPWAGGQMKEQRRGIYFLGIAFAAEDSAEEAQTFDLSLRDTEDFIDEGRHGRSHTPFWQFLDCLSIELLGGPFHETTGLWGWTNLLKIGWSSGSPANWPRKLKAAQRAACTEALREELGSLCDSLVFVASKEELGILYPLVGGEHAWHKDREDAGIWWQTDPQTGNLYVHGYHPNAALRFWSQMVSGTVDLARAQLPRFG
jgi:hypothetical protein